MSPGDGSDPWEVFGADGAPGCRKPLSGSATGNSEPRRSPRVPHPKRGRRLRMTPVVFQRLPFLDVVVERELVGVRAQAEGVDLVGALVADPRVEEVLGEHAADAEEVVVLLEGV